MDRPARMTIKEAVASLIRGIHDQFPSRRGHVTPASVNWRRTRNRRPFSKEYTMPSGATVNTQPSLAHLSHVLRHRELWPADFGPWDYEFCNTCAMGLAYRLYAEINHPGCRQMQHVFGMDAADAFNIFVWLPALVDEKSLEAREIPPEYVADAIDRYLARKSRK